MHRYRIRKLGVSLTMAFLLVALFSSSTSLGYTGAYRAQGYLTGGYIGAEAKIETAAPQIRDGNWSAVRVAVSRNMVSFVSFGEIGWIKWADGRIRVYVSQKDSNGSLGYSEYSTPSSQHTYRVSYYSNNKWRFYKDGTYITERWLGWSQTTEVGSGGETSSSLNAMGVSGCLNNYYKDLDGVWRLYYMHFKKVDSPYHLVDINEYSWQVYGQN